MCVYLSRIDITVTEHHLYGSQIRAVFDQRCGEAVAQHVWGDMTEGRRFAIARNYLPKFLAGYRAAVRLDEKHIGMFPLEQPLPDDEIAPEELDGSFPNWNQPLFTSLPETTQRPNLQLHVRKPEADQFGDSQTDRKSTRLNSSHVRISYAVFCLKKKNNTYNGLSSIKKKKKQKKTK